MPDTRSHSGEGGHGARKAAPPRRTRPQLFSTNQSPAFGGPSTNQKRERQVYLARSRGGIIRRRTSKDNYMYIVCRAHGWLFVCLVLPIERFDFTLKTDSTDVCSVTTLIWQFQPHVRNCRKLMKNETECFGKM